MTRNTNYFKQYSMHRTKYVLSSTEPKQVVTVNKMDSAVFDIYFEINHELCIIYINKVTVCLFR